MTDAQGRLVVVSNRLPFVVVEESDGSRSLQPGSGGLVTALAPVLSRLGGVWVGWPGTVEEDEDGWLKRELAEATRSLEYVIEPVLLSEEERDGFYYGFSNEVIWPLFHDLLSHCQFEPAYWAAYDAVNQKYAQAVAEKVRPGDFVWIHDYQLMLVARHLRAAGVREDLGFFLHIPFPPDDIFAALPWREEVLQALLEYDLVGFQTQRDCDHFIRCLSKFVPSAEVDGGEDKWTVRYNGRSIVLGAFPIGIDFHEFAQGAAASEVSERVRALKAGMPGRQICLGVDRLDYTKGIPHRLEAFRHALRSHPELHGRVTFIQVVVPSREDIPRYQALKEKIEQLVGEINGEFTQTPWVPIHYKYRSLDRSELLAYYRCADVAVITPLKDGMNLVAKEYCAADVDEDGALVLSEFAGAAYQLGDDALIVNPHNIEEVARAIVTGLRMPREERRTRMRRMKEKIQRHDIYRWVEAFLEAARALKGRAAHPADGDGFSKPGWSLRAEFTSGDTGWTSISSPGYGLSSSRRSESARPGFSQRS